MYILHSLHHRDALRQNPGTDCFYLKRQRDDTQRRRMIARTLITIQQVIYFTGILAKNGCGEIDSGSVRVTAADLDLSTCHLSGLLLVWDMRVIKWVCLEGRERLKRNASKSFQIWGNRRYCFLIEPSLCVSSRQYKKTFLRNTRKT